MKLVKLKRKRLMLVVTFIWVRLFWNQNLTCRGLSPSSWLNLCLCLSSGWGFCLNNLQRWNRNHYSNQNSISSWDWYIQNVQAVLSLVKTDQNIKIESSFRFTTFRFFLRSKNKEATKPKNSQNWNPYTILEFLLNKTLKRYGTNPV